ncbi:metallophosphoesterase [Pedobacter sp. BMA]|uniref:metallophosphoesterase n=1 Tax=Pedobacter sp. BMA TaxID=1663685 RepID=UPI00064B518F|nr:metallophosphoesterase [Pedobacter sp. BMA]KLT64781.1 hypothetical protein AB669_13665 [Pedobacter sp. BMA]
MMINFKRRFWQQGLSLTMAAVMLLSISATLLDKPAEEQDEFTIAVLPDTQYYTSEKNGGKNEMFLAQTKWITENSKKENIKFVIHLGDISDDGEKFPVQWDRAWAAMSVLEKPSADYPQGIPYGMAVGNHDQTRSQFPLSGKTTLYNKFFGIKHFEGKKWYGGHYANDNDSHFDLMEANGVKMLILFLEYDSYDEDIEPLNRWAETVLQKYGDRQAILVSHSFIHFNKTAGTNEKGFPAFSKQGQRRFDALKRFPNVVMTLSGHVGDNGEGFRMDGYAGNIIKSYLTDYQSRPQGGHGLMRLITFSKSKDLLKFRTFSPFTGEVENDSDSEFTMPWLHHTTAARFMDFNNDQLTDPVSFADGEWIIGGKKVAFGKTGDLAAPADYNGDGKTEMAVFRAQDGKFLIEGGKEVLLGMAGDVPVCGDWDGDGFADVAVYRPATMTWYIDGMDSIKFGHKNGIPVPADYDGDGKLDVGFFRTDNSMWQTALGNIPLQLPYTPGDIPVPADYNGDGRVDMALYRPATGEWFVGFNAAIKFGQPGDIPVPGNYSPGGKTIPAVYRDGSIITIDGKKIPLNGIKISTLVNVKTSVKGFIK